MVVPALHFQTRLRRLDYMIWLSHLCVCETVPCRSQGKGDVQRKGDTSEVGAVAHGTECGKFTCKMLWEVHKMGHSSGDVPLLWIFFFFEDTNRRLGRRQKSKTWSKTLTWKVVQFKTHPHLENKLATTTIMYLVKNELNCVALFTDKRQDKCSMPCISAVLKCLWTLAFLHCHRTNGHSLFD